MTLVLNKFGTVTEGHPHLTEVKPVVGVPRAPVLQLSAAVEAGSEHPLARAILVAIAQPYT